MAKTKQQILALAEAFIHNQGFDGFSYADIAKQLKIKNAAIHYHFATKEDLGLAVLHSVTERFNYWQVQVAKKFSLEMDKILDFIKIYDNNCYSGNRMCLVGALCSDYYQLSKSMQNHLGKLMNEISSWMSSSLEEGRKSGELSFEGNAQNRAEIIMTSLIGSLLFNRALQGNHYENIKSQLIKDLQVN